MKILLVLFLCSVVLSVGDTENCQLNNGRIGYCVNLQNCPDAISSLLNEEIPQICGFEKDDVLVCCPGSSGDIKHERKPGEISIKKCDAFYPDHERFNQYSLWNGKLSLAKEFPHMAAIGFEGDDGIQWSCGGTLISETFVLTAAHCLLSRNAGPPRHVRLGELDFASETDDAQPQDIAVKRAIPHPDYKPPSKYNDIGLIELESPILRNAYVNIACLDTKRVHENIYVTATGWGKTEFAGKASNYLLKADLEMFSRDMCQKYYKNTDFNTLSTGIDDDRMICAGGESDTCQGDSGGPLFQFHEKKPRSDNVFNIIGITSFGKACGIARIPGVYTRVSNYLQWIEDIVWPQ